MGFIKKIFFVKKDTSKQEVDVDADCLNAVNIPDASLYACGLKKTYGKKEAVKEVNFFMTPGEIVGFLGPNGAGKTTTFYMIAGFITPNSGRIYLNKKDITLYPMYKRARVGIAYLPQESSVFRKLSVEDNIKAVLETRKDLNKEKQKEVLEELLDYLGIESKRKQKAFTLSGGERRRTEIARSLAINPQYLLLDEPFAGIDPIAIHEIKGIMKNLIKKGIGVLITDHNVRETLEITDKSYILAEGRIVISGNKQEIIENEMAREVYLGKDFKL